MWVVISLVVSLKRSSIAAAAGKRHVTVVKKRTDDVTGIIVGQHEDKTGTWVGPEVDVQSSPAVNINNLFIIIVYSARGQQHTHWNIQ